MRTRMRTRVADAESCANALDPHARRIDTVAPHRNRHISNAETAVACDSRAYAQQIFSTALSIL